MHKITVWNRESKNFGANVFINTKCVGQRFIACDQVDWENENGNRFDWINGIPDWVLHAHYPFDMIQPT